METLPRELGPYLLLHKVGEGGFAAVYLALRENKPFLVKVLRPEKSSDPRDVDRFVREVRIASSVLHPNVVSFCDSGKVGGEYFAVMNFAVGVGLDILARNWLACGARPPLGFSLHVVGEISKALSCLHATTVYRNSDAFLFHGDVSLDNILVTDAGHIRLMDFGSAGQESFSDRAEATTGKLAYLPPEVAEGRAPDPATDVYSLGVVAFALLFGRKPFDSENRAELLRAVRKDDVPRVECSSLVRTKRDEAALRIFFNKALNKNPALRFPDIRSFTEAFFAIRFPYERPVDAEAFLGCCCAETLRILRDQRTCWMDQIDRYRTSPSLARKFQRRFPKLQVEDILARQDLRRHPRVRLTDSHVAVEVIPADSRFRSVFDVNELSRGGLMLHWKMLPSHPGQTYPMILRLGKNLPPIQTEAEVCYELNHGSELFVGFKFAEISDRDAEAVGRFVAGYLRHPSTSADPLQELPNGRTLDVFFRSPDDWRTELEQNIRFGGLFIRTRERPAPDENVTVRIHLPEQGREFLLRGRVVFCRPLEEGAAGTARDHGVGVQLDLTDDLLRKLGDTRLNPNSTNEA